MKSPATRPTVAISLAVMAALSAAAPQARAQIATGTLYGTGQGVSPGSSDPYWNIVALPTGYTPPSSVPYAAYVPTNAESAFIGGGSPQTGVTFGDTQNYWIAPQNNTNSLLPYGSTYNWIVQQQFTLSQGGFYRFDFPGAGDNELEFYIDGTVDTSDPLRPTISGGTQIGARAGNFSSISTFTGGAQLAAGTHVASMVLWDYGGSTGALIGQSVFSPTVAYWAPSTGVGGSGTWTTTGTVWSVDATGGGSKSSWSSGVGVGYFGGTSGTVSVGSGGVAVSKMYFTSGGYTVQSAGGNITYNKGALITAETGTAFITATQLGADGVTVAGPGVVRFDGNSFFSAPVNVTSNGRLEINGYVSSGAVTSGNLSGIGTIGGAISGAGVVDPGPANGSGILTAGAITPSAGLDFRFVFSGTAPTFNSPSASVNDLVRLTGGTPFTAALTSSNTKMLFLNMTKEQLSIGTVLKGGFFTDLAADFTSFLNNYRSDNGGFQVYVLGDGAGTDNALNGQGYYNWRNPAMFGWDQSLFLSTTSQTANFSGGTVNGQIMTLVVGVPEPSTYALGICGAGFLGLVRWSKRRRTKGQTAA